MQIKTTTWRYHSQVHDQTRVQFFILLTENKVVKLRISVVLLTDKTSQLKIRNFHRPRYRVRIRTLPCTHKTTLTPKTSIVLLEVPEVNRLWIYLIPTLPIWLGEQQQRVVYNSRGNEQLNFPQVKANSVARWHPNLRLVFQAAIGCLSRITTHLQQ